MHPTFAATTSRRVSDLDQLTGKGIYLQFYDPDGTRHGIPTYPWRWAPAGLLTIRQLRAHGLRPGGQPVTAQILWTHHGTRRVAYLYNAELAKPKRQATPAQLAAIGKALAARRTCAVCGTQKDYENGTALERCARGSILEWLRLLRVASASEPGHSAEIRHRVTDRRWSASAAGAGSSGATRESAGKANDSAGFVFTSYRRTVLAPDELIAAIEMPKPLPEFVRFYKVAKRRMDDISTDVAAAMAMDWDASGKIARARFAFGRRSSGSTTALAAEETVIGPHGGQRWNDAAVERVQGALDRTLNPSAITVARQITGSRSPRV